MSSVNEIAKYKVMPFKNEDAESLGDEILFNRRQTKERRMETVREAEHQSDELKQAYFKEKAQATHDIDQSSDGESFLNRYILRNQDFAKVAQSQKLDSREIAHILADHFDEVEVEVLFDFFEKDKLSLEKAKDLSETLMNEAEDSADAALDGFIRQNNLSLAEIYVLLTYLYEEISKAKRRRDKLRNLVKALLIKMEQQNSAYLFEYFSLLKHPIVSQSPKLAAGIANVSSGNASIATIKDAIGFINEYLDNDFSQLVSKCMKLRVNALTRLKDQELTFEQRSELAAFIRFEKSLISVNSIYNKMNYFKMVVERSKVWQFSLSDDFNALITAVITFAESQLVTEMGMRNLIRGFGIQESLDKLVGFRNKLIQLFEGMPLVIYNDLDSHKDKIIHGLRNSLKHVTKDDKSRLFEFIKPQKELIEYI